LANGQMGRRGSDGMIQTNFFQKLIRKLNDLWFPPV
jgi:hypothetical protein